MSKVVITKIACLPECLLGEAPHWDQDSQSLLYVDIGQGQFHRYFPATGRHQQLNIGPSSTGSKNVTFIIPVEGEPELFVVSSGRGIGLVRWSAADPDQHTTKLHTITTVDDDRPLNRLNDGKCDHKGQLWAGTLGHEESLAHAVPEQGRMYCFSSSLQPEAKVDKINLSNGLTWSNDKTKFYYIDTGAYSVDVFDYNEKGNTVSNRRKLVDYKTTAGITNDLPDGMTIDTDGNLWVANFNGSKLICVDGREGGVLRQVDLPIHNPTSVCFGGPNYDELFLTSSRISINEGKLEEGPDHGSLYHIKGLGVKGTQHAKVNLDKDLINKMI